MTKETKLCNSVNDSCALCGRRIERTRGMSEKYVSGADKWICFDCSMELTRPRLSPTGASPGANQVGDSKATTSACAQNAADPVTSG